MVMGQMTKFQNGLNGKPVSELINLPFINDMAKAEALFAMVNCIVPFWMNPNQAALPYLVLTMVNVTIENGIYPPFAVACEMLGAILSSAFGNYDFGFQLGKLGIAVQDKLNFRFTKTTIYFLFGNMLAYWKKPLREGIPILLDCYQSGIENGNNQYGSYSLNHYIFRNIWVGNNLNDIKDLFDKYYSAMLKLKQPDSIEFYKIGREFVHCLLGNNKDDTKLIGEFFNEDQAINFYFENKYYAAVALYHAFKLKLLCIMGDFENGLAVAKSGEQIIAANFGQPQVSIFTSLSALPYLQCYNSCETKEEYLNKAISIQNQVKIWADNSPDNYLSFYLIISAEIERVKDNKIEAMKLYDEAIDAAEKYSFLQYQALANELAAKFYIDNKMNKIASTYMTEARYCYLKWGAVAKVKRLEKKHSDLFSMFTDKDKSSTLSTKTLGNAKETQSTTSGEIFDIQTIIKATQSLSSEIEMDKLLSKILSIVVENAGAQKVVLILLKDNELFIEGECNENKEAKNILKSIPIDESVILAKAIVRYSVKLKENVILNDVTKEGKFIQDEYVLKNNPKSVLCTPIINQGKVIGAIYMENNISTGAFTESRVEIIKVLSGQAAISIENARLIDQMKEKERLKQEMAIAERIQTSLCPVTPKHNELEITAIMLPAEEVGGDYYDVVNDKNNNTWFAIGDVSGHGVTPGLIMMMAETAFNNSVENSHSLTPKDVINSVNKILNKNVKQRLKESHFMTMSILKYDNNGKFLYAGAHLDIAVYRSKTQKCELFKTDGIYLSIIPDISHITKDFELKLEKGDIMVLYTDGIIESKKFGEREKLWGVDNLCKTIETNADKEISEIKDIIIKEAMDWCNGFTDDDMTMIIIKKK